MEMSVSLNNINLKNYDYSYTKTIIKTIRENRENITNAQFQNAMTLVTRSFKSWVRKYDKLINDFNKQREKNYQMGLAKKQTEDKSYTVEERVAMKKAYDNLADMALKHTKDGYELIHLLREAITGQDIVYRILGQDKDEMFEGNLNLQDILSLVTLGSTKSDVLATYQDADFRRIKNFKLDIANNFKTQAGAKSLMKKNKSLELFDSALYSQLEKLFYNKAINFNRGHVYEMYTYLINEKHFNPNKKVKDPIYGKASHIIMASRKNALRGVKGLKGGDAALLINNKLTDVQLKNISNAGAGLINGLTIRNTMNSVIKGFKKDNLEEEFLKIFTQDIEENEGAITHNLDREMSKQVKKGIESFFLGLK